MPPAQWIATRYPLVSKPREGAADASALARPLVQLTADHGVPTCNWYDELTGHPTRPIDGLFGETT
jgi:hypothetical protein